MPTTPDANTEVRQRRPTPELVAVILAVGMSASIIIITLTIGYAVVSEKLPGTLGENTTQVLISWGGGLLAVLGAYIGYAFGKHYHDDD